MNKIVLNSTYPTYRRWVPLHVIFALLIVGTFIEGIIMYLYLKDKVDAVELTTVVAITNFITFLVGLGVAILLY